MTYFDVHETKQSLSSMLRSLFNCHHHTKVYTDEYLAYERYIRVYSQHQKKGKRRLNLFLVVAETFTNMSESNIVNCIMKLARHVGYTSHI
jgi:hypothetical protein